METVRVRLNVAVTRLILPSLKTRQRFVQIAEENLMAKKEHCEYPSNRALSSRLILYRCASR